MEKIIYLAGGCFWGTEAFLKKLPGVTQTTVGYANGTTENPSYEQVCSGLTGAAETVKCHYNPEVLPLKTLLKGYFLTIDPTSLNQRGADRGTQYRTGIWWEDAVDAEPIQQALEALQQQTQGTVVVESGELGSFYPAEEYHQDYLDKQINGYCHVDLGLAKRFIAEEGLGTS